MTCMNQHALAGSSAIQTLNFDEIDGIFGGEGSTTAQHIAAVTAVAAGVAALSGAEPVAGVLGLISAAATIYDAL